MFNYFRNYSSNAHHACCEDSPTKGIFDNYQSDDLDLRSRSQVCQTGLLSILHYLGQYLSYCIQTWHDSRLRHGIYAHARFDDLELDVDFENICKPPLLFVLMYLSLNLMIHTE